MWWSVEIVDQFVDLSVMYNFNGKFFVTKKQLAAQGRKAMFALQSTMKQLNLNLCTLLSLMVSKFGVPIEDRTLKSSTLSFYGMYWKFVKIQIHLWYTLRQGPCLCILFVFFECSNFGFKIIQSENCI